MTKEERELLKALAEALLIDEPHHVPQISNEVWQKWQDLRGAYESFVKPPEPEL